MILIKTLVSDSIKIINFDLKNQTQSFFLPLLNYKI